MTRSFATCFCVLIIVCSTTLIGTAQDDSLRVGVIKYKTEKKVLDTYVPLFEYIAKKVNRPLSFEIVDQDELGYRLYDGEFDIGVFTLFPYLGAKSDFPDLQVFASHSVNENEVYRGAILTRKESGIEKITDLIGRAVTFVKPTSTSGYHIPVGILEEYNLKLEDFNYDFSGGHDASIKALENGETDAIAIDLAGFRKTDSRQDQFKVLSTYDIPYHAYVFAPKLATKERQAISRVMLGANKDPRARKLFRENSLEITNWNEKNEDYYNTIRRYLRRVRIKPHVSLELDAQEGAIAALKGFGDVLPLLEKSIKEEVLNSKRFDFKENDNLHTLPVVITLFVVDKSLFHYQMSINEVLVSKGDVSQKLIQKVLPKLVRQELLLHQTIETDLLERGNEWFVTYGGDDGINLDHYQIEWLQNGGAIEVVVPPEQIVLNSKNLVLPNLNASNKDQLRISYIPEKIPLVEETSFSFNIFQSNFWKKDYWDKLGLILGILFAIASALAGRFFARRKQERFRNILYQTNELVKDFLNDHLQFEARIIEQKEQISHLLEKGTINENQFMILNKRLEEVEALMDRIPPHEVKLSDDHRQEIADIIADNRITEKEFSRIMNIFRKNEL